MLDLTIYKDNGFKDRDDYLRSLSEEWGHDLNTVLHLADLLGADEDFDGLVTALEDYQE